MTRPRKDILAALIEDAQVLDDMAREYARLGAAHLARALAVERDEKIDRWAMMQPLSGETP